MSQILLTITLNIAISVVIYFSIALVLIAVNGKQKDEDLPSAELAFEELGIDYSGIPALEHYTCRDGAVLDYRRYPADTSTVLILIHGSGWHSRYLLPLVRYLSDENLAEVYTPDLRGHGEDPAERGDIDYIDQLEDDLADLIARVKDQNPGSRIVLGGHSSGGGMVIRFAGGRYRDIADAYLLLTPYLKYNAPTIKPRSGGWAYPHLPRIIGLSMLNNIGIRGLNGLKVIDFNMPVGYRDGTETLSYSHRLNTGYAPRNYKKDLAAMEKRTLVIVGTGDESNAAAAFGPVFDEYQPKADVILLDGVSHMGLVVGEEVRRPVADFLKELASK